MFGHAAIAIADVDGGADAPIVDAVVSIVVLLLFLLTASLQCPTQQGRHNENGHNKDATTRPDTMRTSR